MDFVAALPVFCRPSSYTTIDDYTVIAQTWPATVSTRNMGHWAQVITCRIMIELNHMIT
jgi:hypothetical protein